MATETNSKRISLEINCGYARVAIRELTPKGITSLSDGDITKRANDFQELFEDCDSYIHTDPSSYFTKTDKNGAQFDRHCKIITNAWKMKWNPPESRHEYERTFATEKWRSLPIEEKQNHSLNKCKGCMKEHLDLQVKFPLRPYYQPPPLLTINTDELERLGKQTSTRKILQGLNNSFTDNFGQSFRDALVSHRDQGLQMKPTRSEKKKKLRQIYKKCRDKENESLRKSAPVLVLTQDESLRSYNRKRKLQFFETKPPKKQKGHSPNFDNVVWDKDKVLQDLQEHPSAPPPINWTKFAKEHHVPGGNCGQVVKQFATESGIDTFQLDGRLPLTRQRSSKRKLQGGEISVPTNPPVSMIQLQWQEMIQSGELSLGVPCAPFQLTRFSCKNGSLTREEITILGRKIPLLEIRKKLLDVQEKYMRLNTDEELSSMTLNEIKTLSSNSRLAIPRDLPCDQVRSAIKHAQRQRSLVLWHDHSTILGLGCLLITIHIAYDTAVFLTDSEYSEKHKECANIQSIVEQPRIHLLAAGSSSVEDQISVLQDRLDCITELQQTVSSSNGLIIKDQLKFFIGDHPAQQYERGTQMGGIYKCVCGTKDIRFDDLTHTLQNKWRDLDDLQQVAVAGQFGKQPSVLKPFESLRKADLVREFNCRGYYDIHVANLKKDELTERLRDTLKGVQRVPSLLLFNPQQSLSTLHLQDYTILDCEPLHDLKGHFSHLVAELPYLLDGVNKQKCEEIISSNKTEKMTGARYRITMIQLYLHLKELDVDPKIVQVVETGVRMAEIYYLQEEERSPRRILQLYNCTWIHHELCYELFQNFHKDITRKSFFGIYLHSLVVHGPPQLEIISHRTVNTENQERLFSQARKTAGTTSNRQPQNVVECLIMRLQAKNELSQVANTVSQAESTVARAAQYVSPYRGTYITLKFLKSRLRSWQQHLQRISQFLVHEMVWWEKTSDGYHFYDGDDNPSMSIVGPPLLHFRSTSLKQVYMQKEFTWEKIINNNIELPTPRIQVYDKLGIPAGFIHFTHTQHEVEMPTNSDGLQEATLQQESMSDKVCEIDQRAKKNVDVHVHAHAKVENKDLTVSNPEQNDEWSEWSDYIHVHVQENEQSPTQNEADHQHQMQDNELDLHVHVPDDEAALMEVHVDVNVEDSTMDREEETVCTVSPEKEGATAHGTSECTSMKVYTYKTRHAREIAGIIGNTEDLKQFDDLRNKIKDGRKCSSDKSNYNHLLAKLQLAIQKKRTSIMKKIQLLEEKHHKEHYCLPSGDKCPKHSQLLATYKHINKLLRSWNILL